MIWIFPAPSLNKCRFPSWVANYNHWHTLDYSAAYSFHHRNSTLRITNSSGLEMKVVCTQVKPSLRDDNSATLLLTHFTMGWWVFAILQQKTLKSARNLIRLVGSCNYNEYFYSLTHLCGGLIWCSSINITFWYSLTLFWLKLVASQ